MQNEAAVRGLFRQLESLETQAQAIRGQIDATLGGLKTTRVRATRVSRKGRGTSPKIARATTATGGGIRDKVLAACRTAGADLGAMASAVYGANSPANRKKLQAWLGNLRNAGVIQRAGAGWTVTTA
jgi:hypothetical protein